MKSYKNLFLLSAIAIPAFAFAQSASSPTGVNGSSGGYPSIVAPANSVLGNPTSSTAAAIYTSNPAVSSLIIAGPSDTATKGLYDGGADTLEFKTAGLVAAVFDASQKFVVGNSAIVTGSGAKEQVISTTGGTSLFYRFGGNSTLKLGMSASSTINSHLAVNTGIALGQILFSGDDGVAFDTVSSEIAGFSTGTVSPGIISGILNFLTVNQSGQLINAFIIDNVQNTEMLKGLTIGNLTSATLQGAGALALFKLAACNTAPGAGYFEFCAVAGTTGTTGKLAVLAGTSTTLTAVVDNVGTGF